MANGGEKIHHCKVCMMSSANALTEFISLGGTDPYYGPSKKDKLENLDVK